MCFSSKPQQPAASPPPAENPRPLANPYPDDDEVGNLSQLRIGSKANARRRAASGEGSDGSASTPSRSSAEEGRLTIPKTPPRSQSV